MPTERMGPPPGASPPMRMTASWSGSNDPTGYKSVARRCAPVASSPRILNRPTGTVQTLKLCKKPLSQVIIAPRAQASRRCETQATLAASRQAVLPFRSLDPFRALREPDRRRRDEERLFQLRTKNRQQTKNDHLTGKAPYRFESRSLQERVIRTIGSSAAEKSRTISSCPVLGSLNHGFWTEPARCTVAHRHQLPARPRDCRRSRYRR